MKLSLNNLWSTARPRSEPRPDPDCKPVVQAYKSGPYFSLSPKYPRWLAQWPTCARFVTGASLALFSLFSKDVTGAPLTDFQIKSLSGTEEENPHGSQTLQLNSKSPGSDIEPGHIQWNDSIPAQAVAPLKSSPRLSEWFQVDFGFLNDVFADGNDRSYTQGFDLSLLKAWDNREIELRADFDLFTEDAQPSVSRDDIISLMAIYRRRFELGKAHTNGSTIELKLGLGAGARIHGDSGGDSLQDWFHSLGPISGPSLADPNPDTRLAYKYGDPLVAGVLHVDVSLRVAPSRTQLPWLKSSAFTNLVIEPALSGRAMSLATGKLGVELEVFPRGRNTIILRGSQGFQYYRGSYAGLDFSGGVTMNDVLNHAEYMVGYRRTAKSGSSFEIQTFRNHDMSGQVGGVRVVYRTGRGR